MSLKPLEIPLTVIGISVLIAATFVPLLHYVVAEEEVEAQVIKERLRTTQAIAEACGSDQECVQSYLNLTEEQ